MNLRIRHSLELLYLLVQKELRVRYKSSVLGYVWALANPFAFAVVYYFAFKVIMRVQMPNYSVFLLTGMFPWIWLTNGLVQATASYRNNASLVKKVNLERAVLPLSNVVHEMVHFCFSLPVLGLFIYVTGGEMHASWLWQLPLMMVLQLALVYPVALILALSNVYVHDVEYLVGIGLSLLFFLTPIVYPITLAPEIYRQYFEWSPPAELIAGWRSVLLEGKVMPAQMAYCAAVAVAVSLAAYLVYRKASPKLGELL
jgi:lipopolysaccharide transport system permease protein